MSRKTRKKSRRRKPRNGLLRFLRDVPRWALWTSVVVIVLLYAFLLHYIFAGGLALRWRARLGVAPEPKGYEIRGIDISHYQQTIDWTKVKESTVGGYPLRFVIAKATEGVSLPDKHYAENIRQARRMNILSGAYHFFIPGTNVREQLHHFINRACLQPGDLVPVLDVEQKGSLSKQQLQDSVLLWLQLAEEHYGTPPILYASLKFKQSYLNTPALNRYPFWVARYYTDDVGYDGAWVIWQYTDLGEVDGIKGKVDCNAFNGTMHDLLQLCIKPPKASLDTLLLP